MCQQLADATSADEATLVGLITEWDKMAVRDEVQHLPEWSAKNNLFLITKKTKVLIADVRMKQKHPHPTETTTSCC